MSPTPAPYLEDAGTLDSSVDKVGDHPGRGLVEATFAIPGGEVSSEPGPEDVVASARVAAAAHISSIRVDTLLPTPGEATRLRQCTDSKINNDTPKGAQTPPALTA